MPKTALWCGALFRPKFFWGGRVEVKTGSGITAQVLKKAQNIVSTRLWRQSLTNVIRTNETWKRRSSEPGHSMQSFIKKQMKFEKKGEKKKKLPHQSGSPSSLMSLAAGRPRFSANALKATSLRWTSGVRDLGPLYEIWKRRCSWGMSVCD